MNEAVDDLLQVLNRRDGDLHNERVAASAAMTFEHLVRLFRDLDDVTVIDTGDAHPNKGGYRQSDFRGVNLRSIAGDDFRVFKLADPLDDCRRGESDASTEFGVAHPRILLQFLQYFTVDLV